MRSFQARLEPNSFTRNWNLDTLPAHGFMHSASPRGTSLPSFHASAPLCHPPIYRIRPRKPRPRFHRWRETVFQPALQLLEEMPRVGT